MGILTRAADITYTLRFLRLLTTPFDKTTAFELGIIDEKGKKIRKPTTIADLAAYNAFHRLVFNIKKLIPGKRLGSYVAALFLLKEKYGVTINKKILAASGIDPLDLLSEQTEWFILENKQLSPGVYRIHNEKVLNNDCEDLVMMRDKVRIPEDCFPVGDIYGLDVYEAIHFRSNKKIFITAGELLR